MAQLINFVTRSDDHVAVGARLKKAREAAEFESAADAAKFLGVPEPTYASHENGSRGITARRAQQYASAFKISLDWLLTGRGEMKGKDDRKLNLAVALPIKGSVRAGSWLEIDDHFQQDDYPKSTIPIGIDPKYGHAEQYALRVEGTSMNKVALHGEYVMVADWDQLGRALLDDDLVVVRRSRAMTYEVTLKRVRMTGDLVEPWPESNDPRWQGPIELDADEADVEVKIIGLVIGKYTPPALLLNRKP